MGGGEREPGACGGVRLFRSVPCSGGIQCGQCRWLQSSLRVSPAMAGGHGAVRVRAGGQAGSFKFAPWPPGGGGADKSAASRLAAGQGWLVMRPAPRR